MTMRAQGPAFPRTALTVLRVGHCTHLECMALRGGAWRKGVFPALVGLIRHPAAGAILFDTGYAEHFFAATARLPERMYRWATPTVLPPSECLGTQLARHGIAMHEVRAVFASHLHADHIAGLRDLPRAAIWCADAAVRFARTSGRIARLRRATLRALLPGDFAARHVAIEHLPRAPLPHAWRVLGEGHDLLGDGSLRALPLPGHARGHYGLLLRNQDDREYLLAGDALWRYDATRGPLSPAWPVRLLADDWNALHATLTGLRAIHADGAGDDGDDDRDNERRRDDGRCILPSHCAASYARLPDTVRGTP
ncbi:MAG: MBL fold metallo-hydrolase [Lysobacteraceae bacterium]|nr:MAG: MBL fold metallo-hydrolase [Xanthomonadaceae bacterium]